MTKRDLLFYILGFAVAYFMKYLTKITIDWIEKREAKKQTFTGW